MSGIVASKLVAVRNVIASQTASKSLGEGWRAVRVREGQQLC